MSTPPRTAQPAMGTGGLAQPVSWATSTDMRLVLEKSPEAWQVRALRGQVSGTCELIDSVSLLAPG